MFKRKEGVPLQGRLIYRHGERQLDMEPRAGEGVASLLVNDVQIEIDEEGHLRYVWGYCPDESWVTATLQAPKADVGRIVHLGGIVVPGVSKRLNATKWSCTFDVSSGWLCIGDPSSHDDAVAFAPGAIAVLVAGELVALWLKPELTA